LFFFLTATAYLYLYKSYKRKRIIDDLLLKQQQHEKLLLTSRLEIQEQTLQHLSSELHDNLSQLLSVININLTVLPEIFHTQPAEALQKINDTKAMGKELMGEIKALSVSLNTHHIMHTGFRNALSHELSRLQKTGQYQTEFCTSGEEYRLPPENEIILFRITQEILNNIVKHARAKNITATLHYSPESFNLTISDDGKGFDYQATINRKDKTDSTGLRNLLHRAQLINASLIVNSQPGQGATVTIKLPVQPVNP
jgi:signal transduction histidine kinase